MGRVEALCVSAKKGEPKSAVQTAEFQPDHGIISDAHAGAWHRQVSLLAADDIDTVRKSLPDVRAGAFAENIVLRDADFATWGLGTRLRLGRQIVLRISQIGKACHTPCRIHKLTGDCIMPRLGLFARVETGGQVQVGDDVEAFELVPRTAFQAVVLTISDRCSHGEAEDTAGPSTATTLTETIDAHVYRREVIPDELDTIIDRLKHYSDGHSIDLVLTVGGTGFSPRDVTPEATRKVVAKLTPGLDEAMRAASLAITPHAMLSRAVSGIRGGTLIINLPGSKRGAVENLQAILPALGHGLRILRGEQADCGRQATGKSSV